MLTLYLELVTMNLIVKTPHKSNKDIKNKKIK